MSNEENEKKEETVGKKLRRKQVLDGKKCKR